MNNPIFQIAKSKLEQHLQILIGQPVQEFQEGWDVKIREIEISLVDVSTPQEKKQLISKIKIIIE